MDRFPGPSSTSTVWNDLYFAACQVTVLHYAASCQQVKRGYLSPLFSPGEASTGILHPVLGFTVQEIHGASGANPAKGY